MKSATSWSGLNPPRPFARILRPTCKILEPKPPAGQTFGALIEFPATMEPLQRHPPIAYWGGGGSVGLYG